MKYVKSFASGPASTVDRTKEAWGGISLLLDGIGLPKTSDTGQMIVDNIVSIPTVGTFPQYEIRTWTVDGDTLYIKWEYGVSSSSVLRSHYRITIGTGSNGAGTITGVLTGFSGLLVGQITNTEAYVQVPQYGCNSNGSIAICLNLQFTSADRQTFLFLDRQRNPVTGEIIPSGVFAYGVYDYNIWAKVYNPTYNAASADGRWICPNPGYSTGGSGIPPGSGKTTEIMPFFGAWPTPSIQPVANMFWGKEMNIGYTYRVNVYGQDRTYLAIAKYEASYMKIGCYPASTLSTVGLGMIWE